MDTSWSQLSDIFGQDEDHRLDFKEAEKIEDSKGLAKHFVAFANREGGRLAFGITDDGRLEGASIDEDESVSSISQTSRLFCDPPIQFTHYYYENVEHDGEKGDVLVVKIAAYTDTPYAVIDPKSGVEREYYLRMGNESRPITKSQEIGQLYGGEIDPDKNETYSFPGTLDIRKLSPVEVHPKSPATGFIDVGLSLLSDSDLELIKSDLEMDDELPMYDIYTDSDGNHPKIVRYMREVFPFLILLSMVTWGDSMDTKYTRKEGSRKLKDTVELKNLRDFNNEHDEEILKGLDLEIEDIRERIGERSRISVPAGTDITVYYDSASSDQPARSMLLFEKDPSFIHTISVSYPRNALVSGLPGRHPGYVKSEPNGELGYINMTVWVNLQYKFPDSADPHIDLHTEFGNSLLDYIESRSFSTFQEQVPDPEIFRIAELVESLNEK